MCVASLNAAMRDDGAIEIAMGMIRVADGEEKQIERPSGAGLVFRQNLLDLRAGDQRVGWIVDGAELIDSAFRDRDREGNLDGLIRDDGRIDLGYCRL